MQDSKKILIAKIQAHHGLNGWLKIYSYSEKKENLLNYKYFYLLINEQYVLFDKEDIFIDKLIKIKFKNFNNRESLDRHIGCNLYIDYEQLEKLKCNEYYWNDLIGLNDYLDNEKKIGVLSGMIETGSNDVLVVKNNEKEYLIPYIYGESVKKVLLDDNKIIINKIYYEY